MRTSRRLFLPQLTVLCVSQQSTIIDNLALLTDLGGFNDSPMRLTDADTAFATLCRSLLLTPVVSCRRRVLAVGVSMTLCHRPPWSELP